MSVPSIQSALAQMTALASEASGTLPGVRNPKSADTGGFAGALRASIERIHTMQAEAKDTSQRFQAGAPDVALNDVVLDMQKASIAFQMGLQVRNRLMQAYKEIMATQV